jgi:Uma2 family endonuclease
VSNAVTLPQSQKISSWRSATWAEYLQRIEKPQSDSEQVFFHRNTIWIDMGNEGINHSRFNELFTLIFGFWFSQQTDVKFDLLGGCVIEKPQTQSAAPDKVLYVGGDAPRWQIGEPRRVNLDRWRVPDLVAEISDTTLPIDLDEKKQLYLALGIPEYWVIDVRGRQVWAFLLIDGKYQECSESGALKGLPIDLLEQTLARMDDDNGNVALWFADQIKNLPSQ